MRSKLAADEWPTEYASRVLDVARRWLAMGGDPGWCAAAVQASLDNLSEEPSQYAQKILLRMDRERRDGVAVESPALCDFRRLDCPAGPAVEPPPIMTTPTRHGRQTKAERDAASLASLCESIDEFFGPKGDHDAAP